MNDASTEFKRGASTMAKQARKRVGQTPAQKAGRRETSTDLGNATAPSEPFDMTGSRAHDDHTKRLGNHNHLPRRDPSGARGNEDRRAGPERDKAKR
jgi:hypothetical protein